MKPISLYYEEETRKWLRSNPGKVITLWQVASLFGSAFVSAASMKTAMKGFEATGIWPVNMGVFTDADFLPSEPTNRLIEADNKSEPTASTSTVQINPLPSTSSTMNATATEPSASTSYPNVSPANVCAVPKVQTKEKRKTYRKKGRAVILTSSPYQKELHDSIEKLKRKAQTFKEGVNLMKEPKAKKKLIFTKKKGNNMKKAVKTGDSDTNCLYCNDLYSRSTEGWVACGFCYKWAHNSCAGVDSEDDETPHICKNCVTSN